jgi:hypothetical protein
MQSTIWFYEAGDFGGRVQAEDRSVIQLYGARQVSLTGTNWVNGGSSLRVDPGDTTTSGLIGNTGVSGFSNALFYGGSTTLDGSLECNSGGDAWVEPGISLGSYTINGCAHALP